MKTAVSLLLLGGLLAGCGSDDPARGRPDRSPVLVVGLDGLEWGELIPLLNDGVVPTIAGLMETGHFGRLRTMRPTVSPIIWTCIATGKTPQQHGILGFGKTDGPDGPIVSLFHSRDRRTKAFWNILSEHALRVGVFGWWMTYPVEPVNGVMVAQVNTLDQIRDATRIGRMKGTLLAGVPDQVFPPELTDDLLTVHDRVTQEMPDRLDRMFAGEPSPGTALAQKDWKNTPWALRADATYVELAHASDPPSFDVLALYLGGTDVIAHNLWRYGHPGRYDRPPSAEDEAELGGRIREYYRHVDRELARLLESYGEPVTVILVSDHGMGAVNRQYAYTSDDPDAPVSGGHTEAPAGVAIISGPGIRPPERPVRLDSLTRDDIPYLGAVPDVTPTLLAHLGLPLGRDMAGEVWWFALERDPADVPMIATHDDDAWLSERTRLRAVGVELPGQDARLEQLRALGYVN